MENNFILPTKWKVRITEENREALEQWRIKQPGATTDPRITCLVPRSLDRWLVSNRQDGTYLNWGDGITWEEITYEQFKQHILMENKFTPIAMKCNQEQFDVIRPILEEHGMEIVNIQSFKVYPYLINNMGGAEGEITNGHKNKCNRTVYEEWNQDTFLKACGIEVEFTLPAKWFIRFKNPEQFKIIHPYFINLNPKFSEYEFTGENRAWSSDGRYFSYEKDYDPDYTEITLEQFQQHVLNQNTKMKTYNIKISDLKKIHDVACAAWKSKIKALITDPFADHVELTQTQVDEMFKAALNGQRPVLVEVFGEPAPKYNFKEGEVIWVWDNNNKYPNVRKFIEMCGSDFICLGMDGNGTVCWHNAAPFNNGQLPDEFKHLLENQ